MMIHSSYSAYASVSKNTSHQIHFGNTVNDAHVDDITRIQTAAALKRIQEQNGLTTVIPGQRHTEIARSQEEGVLRRLGTTVRQVLRHRP